MAGRPALLVHFADLPDPRVPRSRLHEFGDILSLALLAVLCGAEGWEDMWRFGRARETWLRERLGLSLKAGIPSADTFRRLFARLDPQALSSCLQGWTSELHRRVAGEVIALDGKTLRGTLDASSGTPALSVVRAWAADNRLILGAEPIAGSEGDCEMQALRRLLKMVDVEGAVVTADALHAQRETAADVIACKADYVLALKDNQRSLKADVAAMFDYQLAKPLRIREWADAAPGRGFSTSEETNNAHGRIETRTAQAITLAAQDPDWRDRQMQWTGLRSFVRIHRVRRTVRAGRLLGQTEETVFYISSLAADAHTLAAAARRHWEAENCMHYVLDVAFGEDSSRVRRDHSAKNLAVMRNIAANLHRKPPKAYGGVRARMKQAGWDPEYLLQLLA